MGKELALALYEQGHYVCATDINMEGLREAFMDIPGPINERESVCKGSDNRRLMLYRLDVRDEANWVFVLGKCRERWHGLDVLMNIAGYLSPNKIQEVTSAEINLHIDVNLKGVVLGTHLGTKLMMECSNDNWLW